MVNNLIDQALRGEPLTVYGDGAQTRSFCYVEDEVRGLLALLDSDLDGPCNIGNPDEFTVRELADLVIEVTDSTSEVVHEDLPVDDPAKSSSARASSAPLSGSKTSSTGADLPTGSSLRPLRGCSDTSPRWLGGRPGGGCSP